MRRPKREFTIFSLAAIDLFCSAMGAFMVISIVLIPYFGRKQLSLPPPERQTLDAQLTEQKAEADQAERQLSDLKQQVAKLKDQLEKSSMVALFGIVTRANSVTVLVDLSGSIYNKRYDPKATDYRPVVQRVCNTIIEGLKPGQRLQIIGFHAPDGVQIDLPAWRDSPVALTEPERQSAKTFVTRILSTVAGGTPTGPALRAALSNETEAIFLITDGAPNDGRREGEVVCDEITSDVRSRNHGKKEIHCIAVGEYNSEPYCVNFLMKLAEENRGQFLGMPNL